MVRPLSCKVLAKDLWECVYEQEAIVSTSDVTVLLGKSMPSPSFIWKGTEIVQGQLCEAISWKWWHSKGHHVHRCNWELPPRPVTLHCLEQPLPPPQHHIPQHLHPALLPCSAGPFGTTGEQTFGFLLCPLHTNCSQTPLTGGLGCFATWVCSWINLCADRDASVQQQSRPFVFALTLLPLLPLRRVNGKQNVCVFQDFSSAPLFPLPFGTMLLIAPNRPGYLTTTIPHSKCMTHYRLFLLPTAYHKR